jgi:plasmid maintenance system antidote protein VapI
VSSISEKLFYKESFMARQIASGKFSIGQMIDSIWQRLPEGHYLFKIDPNALPSPHENLLVFGKAIIDDCESNGVIVPTKLSGTEYSTWLRLVGAWACFIRRRPMARNEAAQLLQMDPSNLTNFINGKRPLTRNALEAFVNLFELQPFDLRSDLGANFARAVENKMFRKLSSLSSQLDELKADLNALAKAGTPITHILDKIDGLNKMVRDDLHNV